LAFSMHVLDICLILFWVFLAFLYTSHHFRRIPYISMPLLCVLQGPDACAAYCCISIQFFMFPWHFLGIFLALSMHVLDICLVLLWVFSALLSCPIIFEGFHIFQGFFFVFAGTGCLCSLLLHFHIILCVSLASP
jgi:hypothetical protein